MYVYIISGIVLTLSSLSKENFKNIPAEHILMPTPTSKNCQTWAVLKDPIFWSDKQLNGEQRLMQDGLCMSGIT